MGLDNDPLAYLQANPILRTSQSIVSDLHEERLATVTRHLLQSGAARILDLGCGAGELLQLLAQRPQFTRLVGIDIDHLALSQARAALGIAADDRDARIQVRYGSFEQADPALCGFDAAVMLETIEHIEPRRLSVVEEAVFGGFRPASVLITTPNQEFNRLHGMAPGEFRHAGHRFEWPRAKFRQWARGVATRKGYLAEFFDVGPAHPVHGSSTQMARFTKIPLPG